MTRLGRLKTIQFNGQRVHCLDRPEARAVARQAGRYFEVFQFTRSNPVLVDVGAHVGLFTLEALRRYPEGRIYAFELSPITYALYLLNTFAMSDRIKPHNLGLADRHAEVTFNYFPLLPSMSSLVVQSDAIAAVDSAVQMLGMPKSDFYRYRYLRLLPRPMLRWLLGLFIRRYFRAVKQSGQVTTLSAQIESWGIQQIDLLKVDVEGAEEQVLDGIADPHWALIQRVALEIHDIEGRVARLERQLEDKDFTILDQQHEGIGLSGEDIVVLFAQRRSLA
ncbi:MAG: FkbM family methyltransferase [Chloroflexi bacterium]|nr:FkbM family methyltransferase [Chloroflexota bacterium]